MSSACQCHVEGAFCFYCEMYSPVVAENERLKARLSEWTRQMFTIEDRALAAEAYGYGLRKELERLRGALERMDDRKNPMLPRSVMARIAKEALDYAEK